LVDPPKEETRVMRLITAAAAALSAVAAFLRFVYPVREMRAIQREIEKYEDEIFSLGNDGSPDAKLRMEILSKRRDRASQQLGTLRSAYSDLD
jgi:hypothetical protein